MVDAIGEVKTPIYSRENSTQDPNQKSTTPIDDTIAALLDTGEPFEFTYKNKSYSIIEKQGKYVALDSKGEVVDPNVQLNSKKTVDGFLEVRGLYGSGGQALYIGNDPAANSGEILMIEASPFLDRQDLLENPHLAQLLGKSPDTTPKGDQLDIKQLKLMMDFADTKSYQLDKDRSVNIAELDLYLKSEFDISLSDKKLTELFGLLDQNNSGNIREAEFNRFTKQDGSGNAGKPEQPNAASDIDFRDIKKQINYRDASAYQIDRDRSINMEELDNYLKYELGITLSDEKLTDFFSQLDQNDSGNIRESEFNRATRSNRDAKDKPADRPNDASPPPKNDDRPNNTRPDARPNDNQQGQVLPPSRNDGGSPEVASKRFNVSRNQTSPWSSLDLPKGTADVQYESLGRPYKGPVSTDGADYILIIKSGGKQHNSIDNPESFFGTKDGDILGVTGSKDKGTMLIDVKDLDKIQMDTGNASVQIIRIKTDEELTVLNDGRGALDNDLVRGGRSKSDAAIRRLGYSIEHRRVEAWNDDDNFFTVYADDESKYDHRVEKYGDASEIYYYGGDDSAYLMPPGARADKKGSGSGNGAIIHIGVK